MDASERKTRAPSKSEREILLDISLGRVTRETAAAMWDHLVPGALLDAAGMPLEKDEASDIRTQFMDAVEGLAESEIPHARLVLSRIFVPALAERASVPFEFLITTAQKEGPEGQNEAARLLLRKAHLFDPAHPPTAIDAYRRWIELRPRSEPARQRLKSYQVSWDDHARYQLGRLLHRTGDLAGAERVYRDLLALPAGTPVVRSRALKALATTVGALGRREEELELRGQAARETKEWMDSLAARFNEKAARARAATDAEMERLSHAAAEATERGDHHAADASLRELLGRQQQHGKPVAAANTLWQLAETAVAAGELDAAAYRYRGAARAFEELGMDADLAGVLWNHARMEMGRGRLDEAEELFQGALKLEKHLGEADSAIVTLMQLAKLEDTRGRPVRALRWLDRALDLAVESGNAEKEGWVAGALAKAARDRENPGAERAWTERSIQAYERAGNQERLGRQLESLGRIHFRAGEFQAAVVPTERAGAIFEQIGDREALGRALSLLGVIELRRERLESAERYLRLASAIHMERFDNRSAASSLSALGELAYRRGDLDAARDAWQKALARYSNMDLWESEDAKRIRAMLDRTR
jgi:tetratricopeptide (TPR) repeat protein